MTSYKSIIKTEIAVKTELTEYNDDEHYFRLRMSPELYNVVKTMLSTGAPVWLGIQIRDGAIDEQKGQVK